MDDTELKNMMAALSNQWLECFQGVNAKLDAIIKTLTTIKEDAEAGEGFGRTEPRRPPR